MSTLMSILVLATTTALPPPVLAAAEAPALCSGSRAPLTSAGTERPGRGAESSCTATADCGPFADVSCSGSASCSAIDRSCPGEQGHVTCDGNTTYCPSCEDECVDGHYKFEIAGPFCGCDAGGAYGTERDVYKCIDGQWVFQETICGGPFCLS